MNILLFRVLEYTKKPAIVLSNHTAPRSYIIQTFNGMILRRNRCHLKRTNEHVKIAPSYDDNDIDGNITSERPVDNHSQNADSGPVPCSNVTGFVKTFLKGT